VPVVKLKLNALVEAPLDPDAVIVVAVAELFAIFTVGVPV
jgi:hypothetical protein